MARKQLGFLLIGLVCLGPAMSPARAGENSLQQQLSDLNQITGGSVVAGAMQRLVDDKENAKALLQYALPAAKKNELSYNAALVLGGAAADLKDLKTAEVYMRVCMEKGSKLQSVRKLGQSYVLLAELYFRDKKYADTVRICKELTDIKRDGKERVVIQTMRDKDDKIDFGEPQDGFRLAERIRPYVYELHVKALAKQGKIAEALALLDKEKVLIEPIVLGYKGWVLREAGKFDAAADAYEKAIAELNKEADFESDELEFRYELANVYVDSKKIEQATEHLEYIIRKRPDSPIFYNDLGFIWADNGIRLEEAEKYIRKALELDRARRRKSKTFDINKDHDSGAYLDSLAWVLFKQKKTEQAKKWLLLAIEDKDSRHIEIYDHLGDVYMALGEREAAIRAWEDGLKFVNEGRRDAERKVLVERKIEKAKAK